MRRLIIILAASAALAGSALAQQAPALQCPDDELDKVRQYKPLPALMGALMPPLLFLHALARDPLSDKPTREVSVRVVDESGKAVPNALVALIYRKDAGKRFLAEGAAGGGPINLPHGRYLVNAATSTKDRGVRYGSTEVSVGPKGPSNITVKLTAQAAAPAIKPAARQTFAGGRLSVDVAGTLRERTVLAVMPRGANASAEPDDEPEKPLSQHKLDGDGPAAVQMPSRAGSYDVVAMLCAPRIRLSRTTVTATPPRIAIEAPERASRGQTLRATVSGNLDRSFRIEITRVGDISSFNEWLSGATRQTFAYKVPREAGIYEITLNGGDNEVLARRTVNVEFEEVSITGPDKIRLGQSADFSWPETEKDKLRLELWTIARDGKPAARVSEVRDKRIIAASGDYELRLFPWGLTTESPFGRKPLRIEGEVFVNPPAEVIAGTRISVGLTFKPEFFDQLSFYERGSTARFDNNPNHRNDNRVIIETPKKPGSYDLVFFMGSVGSRVEVGRVPVEVRPQGYVLKPVTGASSGQEKEQDACCSNPVGAAFDALKPATKGELAK